jgi:valyl-tRNA synthetase
MNDKFLKPYNPQDTEGGIYKLWEESGFFNPDVCIEKGKIDPEAGSFSMIMPPPNVTGVLHMGHALMLTTEDIMVRYNRMLGKKTLWIPGTDHAAIATQSKVEKEISKKEGKSRHDLGREEMLRRIEAFAKESHDTITSQVRVMGASCDWSREAFTLDEKRNVAVNTVFKRMYDDGLIYRANKIVNWDPKGQTTISDDEIVYEERKAKLYTFKYSKDFPIPVATTRLETKVGDTAVAVHPEDARYQKYIGQTFEVSDFCGVKLSIKITADEGVEKDFGTGALGVTPAHSMIDAEMAVKNNLPTIQVLNEYAKMIVGDERLLGKKVTEAREIVAEWLRGEGLMIEEKEITQNVSTAERTGGIVEPLPKLQWFVNVNKEFTLPNSQISGIESGSKTTLKEIMKKAVAGGQVGIIPEHFSKTYFHWIDNLRDWCISRQIWYGHRVPVWYQGEALVVGEDPKDGSKQDEDTLDTWFSSALWTFSTLGWPDETEMQKNHFADFHPTNMLETGYEILFFWVARMILMSGYCLGEIPFEKVYLHGTVRDAKGQKMSKSLGNGIDPLDVAKEFGSDAGRMALIIGTAPGTDSKISNDKIKGYRNFANKIWNITRFILTAQDEQKVEIDYKFCSPTPKDLELIKEQAKLINDVTKELNEYKMHLASDKVYQYAWARLADVILEESKIIFKDGTAEEKYSRIQFLLHTLENILKILHPFMPFVTEEIWQTLKNDGSILMVERWPIMKK